MSSRKVMVIAAHDDDSILGVGGVIAMNRAIGDEVWVVIGSDGAGSHAAVLKCDRNPSPCQVKDARRKEILAGLDILGVPERRVLFLDLPGSGKVRDNISLAQTRITGILTSVQPSAVLTHHPDAHPEHRVVSNIVKDVITTTNSDALGGVPALHQFFIWTKELAEGRSDATLADIPEIPGDAGVINLPREILALKRQALFCMKSQVNVWPYPDWQVQPIPILDKKFVDYFLRGQEILIRIKLA